MMSVTRRSVLAIAAMPLIGGAGRASEPKQDPAWRVRLLGFGNHAALELNPIHMDRPQVEVSPDGVSRWSSVTLTTDRNIDLSHLVNKQIEKQMRFYEIDAMLEDAMLIHRVQHAPVRRIFNIDAGTMSPDRAKAHIEQIKFDMRQFKFDAHIESQNEAWRLDRCILASVKYGDDGYPTSLSIRADRIFLLS